MGWFGFARLLMYRGGGGKDLHQQLAYAYQHDITFFNGVKIGETPGGDSPKNYFIPGTRVKGGRNVLAVRLKGSDGVVGIYEDNSSKLSMDAPGQVIPRAGTLAYQPGPDLTAFPQGTRFGESFSHPNVATVNAAIIPLNSRPLTRLEA